MLSPSIEHSRILQMFDSSLYDARHRRKCSEKFPVRSTLKITPKLSFKNSSFLNLEVS